MLKKLFSREEIDRAVKRLATEIENDYDNEQIIFICLLKGSFMFTADLIRKIRNPLRVDFLRASSYGCGTNSKGEVTIGKDIEEGIESENVIIVEDIIDSGLTLTRVRNMPVSYTHLRAHETVLDLVCRLLLEKKNHTTTFT